MSGQLKDFLDMKNCPFCGSAAVGPAYYTQTDGQERTMIQCSKCGATGPSRAYSSEWGDEEAEASWDKRHNVQSNRPARHFAQVRLTVGLGDCR